MEEDCLILTDTFTSEIREFLLDVFIKHQTGANRRAALPNLSRTAELSRVRRIKPVQTCLMSVSTGMGSNGGGIYCGGVVVVVVV